MSQLSNKLTAKAAKNLSYNPKGKNKYADGGGLYLLITANGANIGVWITAVQSLKKEIRLL